MASSAASPAAAHSRSGRNRCTELTINSPRPRGRAEPLAEDRAEERCRGTELGAVDQEGNGRRQLEPTEPRQLARPRTP